MGVLKGARSVGVVALLTTALVGAAAAQSGNAVLKDGNSQVSASSLFWRPRPGSWFEFSLKGMPPGEHALHFHAVSKCEPPSFDSAVPHFNPGNAHHGFLVGPGHAGDMPNLHIPQTGAPEVELVDTAITTETAKPNSVSIPAAPRR